VDEKHRVRFEPVDLEIEVEESETILEGAFRQGVTLMHGCKEGQCSACKSFLIDGDVEMDRYSTFALPEYESEEGYVLLCRSHAYSDCTVELINYDEDMLHSGTPIQTAQAEVAGIEVLTRDIRHLRLALVDPPEMTFLPGQYVDITIPGGERRRAYSMANTPSTTGVLEFMIKLYPGGRFSGLLEGGLVPGDRLSVKGPYGTFTLRERSDADLVFVGGGAGMAPIWSILSAMAERGSERRATYYYGARTTRDLFLLPQMAQLAERLPGFQFVPALSEAEAAGEDDWTGERGFITEVLDRREGDLSESEAYLCGPPPMIDAAIELLKRKKVAEEHIFFDKFTTTADAEEGV